MADNIIPIKNEEIDWNKINWSEDKVAQGEFVDSSSVKSEYWGEDGTSLEAVPVDYNGDTVYRIDEIDKDGNRVGMGFTTEDGLKTNLEGGTIHNEWTSNYHGNPHRDSSSTSSISSDKVVRNEWTNNYNGNPHNSATNINGDKIQDVPTVHDNIKKGFDNLKENVQNNSNDKTVQSEWTSDYHGNPHNTSSNVSKETVQDIIKNHDNLKKRFDSTKENAQNNFNDKTVRSEWTSSYNGNPHGGSASTVTNGNGVQNGWTSDYHGNPHGESASEIANGNAVQSGWTGDYHGNPHGDAASIAIGNVVQNGWTSNYHGNPHVESSSTGNVAPEIKAFIENFSDEFDRSVETVMDDNIAATVTENKFGYLTHIQISNPSQVEQIFANDGYRNGLETTLSMAERHKEFPIMINSYHFDLDTYDGKQDLRFATNTIAIHDGEVIDTQNTGSVNGDPDKLASALNQTAGGDEICLMEDGSFRRAPLGATAQELLDMGVKETFSSHDAALIVDGELNEDSHFSVDKNRTVIATTETPGEYYIITGSGKNEDMANYLLDLGCNFAKSMDQGGSVSLCVNGREINTPTDTRKDENGNTILDDSGNAVTFDRPVGAALGFGY